MRKVVLYIAASVDGFIAKNDGSIDWLEADVDFGDIGFEEFTKTIDTVLMGRKTYEQILNFEEWHYKEQDCHLFSRSPVEIRSPRTFAVSKKPGEFVNGLKIRPGKDIWLLGGGDLNHAFLNEDLIDEIMLFIQPVFLGCGIGLFGMETCGVKNFNLVETRSFDNGFVFLRYQPVR